jgi:hypothetical protein
MQASETDREGRGGADVGGSAVGTAAPTAPPAPAGVPPLLTVISGFPRFGRPPQPLMDPNYR